MEKLFFENSKGDRICGVLSDPNENQSPAIVILCHGFTSNKDRPKFTGLEKLFNEKGLATFRFDFFGHGESEGEFENITISEAVEDILKAIDFVKSKGYEKIALVGSSFGGIASIMAASKTKELFALGLSAPVSDFVEEEKRTLGAEKLDEWKTKGFRFHEKSDGTKLKLNYSVFEDAKKHSGYKAAEKIEIPVLIVHGDNDETVPIEQSKKTSQILKNCRLEIIEGADHRFSKQEWLEKLLELIADFIAGKK